MNDQISPAVGLPTMVTTCDSKNGSFFLKLRAESIRIRHHSGTLDQLLYQGKVIHSYFAPSRTVFCMFVITVADRLYSISFGSELTGGRWV